MMWRKKLNKKGVTLIELVVVFLIVAILATVSIPIINSYVRRAKATEAYAILATVKTAERVYYATSGVYTNSLSLLGLSAAELNGEYFSGNVAITLNSGGATYVAVCSGIAGGTMAGFTLTYNSSTNAFTDNF